MIIYLAARYGRRDELRQIRDDLHRMGHTVASRWIDTEWRATGSEGQSAVAPPEEREKFCLMDLEDLLSADCCISLSEEPNSASGKRGGRHVEFGVAMEAGLTLIVVGPRENIFHHHPRVKVFPTWEQAKNTLAANYTDY